MKKIKDPVYGYIEIERKYMGGIVDTAPFQRLRRISQTSYAPLYSSAVHNRFVHSLGVYHLGRIAAPVLLKRCKELTQSNQDIDEVQLEKTAETFCIACLLHDVGHAPFSHTGEDFYLENESAAYLHEQLKNSVGSDEFAKDIPGPNKHAAPHEIMSAIVGLDLYGHMIQDHELFVRCITGYQYTNRSIITDVKNCFIQLLNSKIIDVDKLDYLTRDAYITGYDTVKIDYLRLLRALTIEKIDGKYSLAFHSSAVSVIENAIYAHDSEKKWIQNHPVILYENYLLKHSFGILEKKNEGGKLFSRESLSVEGVEYGPLKEKIRLLSDDDIVHLMKQNYEGHKCIEEYFCRDKRKHPIWKSEAEYRTFFLGKIAEGEVLDSFEEALKNTIKYLTKSTSDWVINEKLETILMGELEKIEAIKNGNGKELSEDTISTQILEKNNILKVVQCLMQYAKEKGYLGDFVLLQADQFNSAFAKPDFSKIPLVFGTDGEKKVVTFEKVAASFSGRKSIRKDFFYLFYDRGCADDGIKMSTTEICSRLLAAFV